MIQNTYTGPVPPSKDDNKNKNELNDIEENTLQFNSKVVKLLLGKIVDFDEDEIIELVKMIGLLDINTLSIQYSTYGNYICKVDNKTLKYYENKK